MAQRSVTRDMPKLSLRASFEPSTVNVEKRTVQLTWTTGAPVLRGFWDRYYEELSLDPKHVRMERLQSGKAPLLDTHNGDGISSVIGVVESAELQKKRGVATVRFDTGAEGEEAFRKVREGILGNVSVGYSTYKMEKVSAGDATIPTFRAVDWEPAELSMVPVGADPGAVVRSRGETTPCEFVEEITLMADDNKASSTPATPDIPAAVAVTQAATLQRAEDAKRLAAQLHAAREEAAAQERLRSGELYAMGEQSGLGEEWARKQIAIGTSVEDARRAAWTEIVKRDKPELGIGGINITAGDDARDKFVRGGLAWMLERCGHTQTVAGAKKVERLGHLFKDVSNDPGEFRGMRMTDLARYALELRGGRVPKGLHGEQLIRRALETRGDQGFNTTSDFAILLETAMNKIFVAQYALAPVTWPMWAGRKSVADFRTSTFYRPGTFGVLDTVTEAGEIKHKNIPDGEKRTVTPGTKANIIGITRRALANDDLGAFTNLASGLGLAAAFTIEADAFAMISPNSGLGLNYDANPLFHSSRSNIGPTGAMSPATLDGARAVMAKQKDPSANQFLALRPAVWLGPVELGGVAKQFNASTTDPTDNKAQGVSNKVLNLFRDIVDSPYLSATSATRHYLLADPALYPVFAVAFIDGQEAPRIESEQSFNFDGLQLKVIVDYGTAVIDFRGAVTCAGV